jgi:hypothetical protein
VAALIGFGASVCLLVFAVLWWAPAHKAEQAAAFARGANGRRLPGAVLSNMELKVDPQRAGMLQVVSGSKYPSTPVWLDPRKLGFSAGTRPENLKMVYDKTNSNMVTLVDQSSGKKALVSPTDLGFPEGVDPELLAVEAHNQRLLGTLGDIAKQFEKVPDAGAPAGPAPAVPAELLE